MHHLGRIVDRGPRRIVLLGGMVLLPAAALGLLAFRAFQGGRVREEYQHRERQQQILRLLESDLGNWALSRCGEAEGGRFAFEVRQNRILLTRLNVYLSPDRPRAPAPRLPSRDSDSWHNAQTIEFRGETTAAVQNYRRLLSGNPIVSSWSKLALLRLSLRRAAPSDATHWLKEIQDTDQEAMTESGIPIRVAAALLLVEYDGAALPAETAGFLSRTLSQLAAGCWSLSAAQSTYYTREICSALSSTQDLCSEALATAGFLESFSAIVDEVLALNQNLEWRRDQPFAARHLPGVQSVAVLYPGEDRRTGCVLPSSELTREAQTRLSALTAAEDFEGRIGISGDKTQPAALSLPNLPFLGASFPERDHTLWRSHLRRYSIFYATALLLFGAGAGLFFTYRAVAREMEVSRMKAEFVSSRRLLIL